MAFPCKSTNKLNSITKPLIIVGANKNQVLARVFFTIIHMEMHIITDKTTLLKECG